jgi:hypothetical protein
LSHAHLFITHVPLVLALVNLVFRFRELTWHGFGQVEVVAVLDVWVRCLPLHDCCITWFSWAKDQIRYAFRFSPYSQGPSEVLLGLKMTTL